MNKRKQEIIELTTLVVQHIDEFSIEVLNKELRVYVKQEWLMDDLEAAMNQLDYVMNKIEGPKSGLVLRITPLYFEP